MIHYQLELEQNQLVNTMHLAKIQGHLDSRKCSQQTIAHSKQIKEFAAKALNNPEVKAQLEIMKKHKPDSFSKQGGFNTIAERVAQHGWTQEERLTVLAKLRGKVQEQSHTQTQGRSR